MTSDEHREQREQRERALCGLIIARAHASKFGAYAF